MRTSTRLCAAVFLLVGLALGLDNIATARAPRLVAVAVPGAQKLQDLAKDRFVERVTCSRTCATSTKVLVQDYLVHQNGSGTKLVVIGTASATVKAGKTAKVAIRLNDGGKQALKHIGSLELYGRVGAVSAANPADTGSAVWHVFLKR